MAEQGLPVTVRIQARLQDDQRAEVIDALFEALLARVSPPSRVTGSELVVGVHGEPRAVLAHLEVAPVVLCQRSAYANAWIDGRSVEEYEPDGKAAAEICALYRWLIQRLIF